MIIACVCLIACSDKQEVQLEKPHHTAEGFKNLFENESPSRMDFFKWRWERWKNPVPGPETYHFPLVQNDAGFLQSNRSVNTLTWIGHATVLLQINGVNILTDPQFSERASPVSWAGPRRVVAPGVALEDLPSIDVVVISHDHYDSLDLSTVQQLARREQGEETVFIVPLRLKAWFEDQGINNVIELDWWEEFIVKGITLTAVPAQHWSKRSLFSSNKTLWAGWGIKSPDYNVYFVGDSGYAPHFKLIGERLGPFDLSLMPIGAYEPRWFMGHSHVNPEEAVQAHLDVKAKRSIAIHWGTFILTDEPLDEPPVRLKTAMEQAQLDDEEFVVMKHGESLLLEQ
jgi:L-ascorbate metabolism protein UlaG (beta-lactamase superfamily)